MFASHVDRGWPTFEILDRAKMNGDALYVVLIEKHERKTWMQRHFIQVDHRFELFLMIEEIPAFNVKFSSNNVETWN